MKKSTFEKFQALMVLFLRYFKWFVIVAVALIALTGIYKVDSNEVALVLRFGHLVGQTAEGQIKRPGLHFAFPYIIDEVIKVPVESVQELSVTTHYGNGGSIASSVNRNGYVITGDSNIILIKTVVKYKVSDPVAYALAVSDISAVIDGVTSGETTAIVASMTVDDVLTSQKSSLSNRLKENVQAWLDTIGCGVQITNVELTNVTPPKETAAAFDNVTAAAVQKQTLLQQAKDYQAAKIPEAEATASELVNTATVNRSQLLSKANDEAAQFNGLYAQYVLNPNVIRDSVFRSRVSAVLKQSGATIITPDGGGSAKIVLP
ncbi:MAG: FtsH protease activity modulator HflK [Oscillospiraceae bacterium]|jgi:membrane protease subunit HflK|nr:FtsH protease activity modulator HflK [Oscillospiraceae bacterium]